MENKITENKKVLAPKLRFGEFEGEWKIKRMETLFSEFKSGNSITAKDIFDNADYPVYGGNGIRGYATTYTHEGEYFLIGRQGALCGNINRVIGKLYISEHAVACKANGENDTLWLSQRLDFMNLNRLSESSAQPGLSVGKLLRIKLPIPSLPEQQKIASFLSAVDEKIQLLNRKKELLEDYKKGIMQKLFPKKAGQSPELRFKRPDGSNFPDWEEKKLGKLIFKVGKKNSLGTKYPIYSINNQEGFRPQSEQFDGLDSNDRGYDISLYKIVESNTFAYNPARINVGSIGYSYDLEKVIVSSLYVCFKTIDAIDDKFLLVFLDTFRFNKDILRFEEGGVRQYLFYENFSQIKLPYPSIEEQKIVADFLSAIDQKINQIAIEIKQTQTFKKGLLQQMFV